MSNNLGTSVSRVLDPSQRNFNSVVMEAGRPPVDADVNLIGQIAGEVDRLTLLRGCPSGWLSNDTNAQSEFVTNPEWSNWFKFGRQRPGENSYAWAVVNGWLIPVTGTKTGSPPGSANNSDTWNKICLAPPPNSAGDGRVDFVFLEVWLARVAPTPSTTNKPSSSYLYRYGNAEGGYSYLPDDLIDQDLGMESSQRVQIQYRLRVVTGLVGLSAYPDGFDPSVVKAQGAGSSPTAYVFENMRATLGDPGLWRAGDGTANGLGTVDGYSYAIPLCGVFRRNSVAWDGEPGQNLNGSFDRNPTAIDRTGVKTFSTIPVLGSNLSSSAMTLSLMSTSNVPLPSSPASAVYIQIGDEVLAYTSISGTTVQLFGRGQLGSKAEYHKSGSPITILSGRPDGLFADQIATTDVLDMRHVVNPNGFDYLALLQSNLDSLLQGKLRANWKRSGAGPSGPFVAYQDKIGGTSSALGVTQLDNTDGFRSVYSDSAVVQKIEVLVSPPPGAAPQSIGVTWGMTTQATATTVPTPGSFVSGTVISIPVAQFKNSVPGADQDQIRFVYDGQAAAVSIRVDGEETPRSTGHYAVSPASPSSADDLVITLGSSFVPTTKNLCITVHLMIGPGRGLSRRPDSVHSICYLNPTAGLLTQQVGIQANNIPSRVAWAPLWSKYRATTYRNMLPVTAEAYVDPGSKTVVLTPFRMIAFPTVVTTDGTNVNYSAADGGLMPLKAADGTPKWATTDPLSLFANTLYSDANRKNIHITVPRQLIPGWGSVMAPILYSDTSSFAEGINYIIRELKGDPSGIGAEVKNFVPHSNGPRSFSLFSTLNLNVPQGPATYNAAFSYGGGNIAGIRQFTDSRGLGRKGLQLPPFYGIARLFAVYEAQDYVANGSSYNATTREYVGGGAVNLLRQNFSGPTFWVETDVDGDSTFIINADALDLSKSSTPISAFSAGDYVIEAAIFGFDRGSFDLTRPFRLVLTRERTEAVSGTRSNNIGVAITGPNLVIPAPPPAAQEFAVNYSRTPYQGDAWGSMLSYSDIARKDGPLQTSVLYELLNSTLNQTALTRPNQKALEVLASIAFETTLGSGRIAGDASLTSSLDFRNPGFEDYSTPPSTPSDARPRVQLGGLVLPNDVQVPLSTQYHNCIERLPLGAIFRDKDFRGNQTQVPSGFSYIMPGPGVISSGLAADSALEQVEVNVFNATMCSGQAGEVVVHVDGEPGNYSVLTNFRTNRGGSAFSACGDRPGGELGAIFPIAGNSSAKPAVLCAIAYLVRNAVTAVGAQEVSAGDEIMLLVVTTAVRLDSSSPTVKMVQIGTNGTREGYSAADLYRISGRPLIRDNVKLEIDPSSIALSSRSS